EFAREVCGRMPAVNVITQHDDEIEIHFLTITLHLLCHFVLLTTACAAVTDHGKANGFILQRKLYIERSVRSGTVIAGGNGLRPGSHAHQSTGCDENDQDFRNFSDWFSVFQKCFSNSHLDQGLKPNPTLNLIRHG